MNKIKRAYSKVPKVHCKGKCRNSCGPIHISRSEMNHIKEHCTKNSVQFFLLPETCDLDKLIEDHKNGKTESCPYLKEKGCSVYEARPLICRLWGTSHALPCPHGCELEGDLVTDEQGSYLMQRVS